MSDLRFIILKSWRFKMILENKIEKLYDLNPQIGGEYLVGVIERINDGQRFVLNPDFTYSLTLFPSDSSRKFPLGAFGAGFKPVGYVHKKLLNLEWTIKVRESTREYLREKREIRRNKPGLLPKDLREGEIYMDKRNAQLVEYKYIGQTGYAIVCDPGDSGGGMQSSWEIMPNNLEYIVDKNNSSDGNGLNNL